jgi:2-iminobutanoate/2-iminopropanoate deaminase
MRVAAGLLLGVMALTAAKAADQRTGPAPSGLPFTPAVPVGETLYVSGHLGFDPKTGQAPADPRAEAAMVLDAVKQTVEGSGFTMDDLVSVTVYCTDLALYDTFNGVYRGYFHGRFPARAFIGVSTLLRGAHFEVQGIAVRRSH